MVFRIADDGYADAKASGDGALLAPRETRAGALALQWMDFGEFSKRQPSLSVGLKPMICSARV